MSSDVVYIDRRFVAHLLTAAPSLASESTEADLSGVDPLGINPAPAPRPYAAVLFITPMGIFVLSDTGTLLPFDPE